MNNPNFTWKHLLNLRQSCFTELRTKSDPYRSSEVQPRATVNKAIDDKSVSKRDEILLSELDSLLSCSRDEINRRVRKLMGSFSTVPEQDECLGSEEENFILGDLRQIASSRTLERKLYYIRRMIKSLQEIRTNGVNDLNLNKWKEYPDIITDSLWLFEHRESTNENPASYWGNFVPQIPHQLMMRYTKPGEWVMDPFAGSGTTLFEAARWHRKAIGIELSTKLVNEVSGKLRRIENSDQVSIFAGDSRTVDYADILREAGTPSVQLVILHPPYHNIIRFSEDSRDLSNYPNVQDFLDAVSSVVIKSREVLDEGRYLALVMGDKYENGTWIPLGFYCMEKIIENGFSLQSIVVKNFDSTRGKRSSSELWRFRALAGGYYIFKHEYIFIFRKKSRTRKKKNLA